jgi:3-methyladenine DNA glycosylase AlkD
MKKNKHFDAESIIKRLKSLSNPEAVEGMARFGINSKMTLGVSIPHLRKIAKDMGKNHKLALNLWETGIHEARILAGMIDEPDDVSEEQMEQWAGDFDSWDVCDQVCMNLFKKSPIAYEKAVEWSKRDKEFVKRAGFALMAVLAVGDKKAGNDKFAGFLPYIKKGSTDGRNFVKKAVNWALRQIGKRNLNLNKIAIKTGEEIYSIDSKSAKWVASNALRELKSKDVQKRLINKERSH